MNQNKIDWPSLGAALAVLVLGLLAGTAWNSHPYQYHRDEPSKVNQVSLGYRNFHHPTMMLEVASTAVSVTGTDRSDRQVLAVLGRTISALWMALAAAALFLAGKIRSGWWAAVSLGAIGILLPIFVDVAHRFKEDAPQHFGMALCLLATSLAVAQRRPLVVALTAGLGCGVAGASKYAGFAWLLPMAALLLLVPVRNRSGRVIILATLLGVATVPFLLAHAGHILGGKYFTGLSEALEWEASHLKGGHDGLGAAIPNWAYLYHLLEHTWLVFLFLPLLTWKRWFQRLDWPLAIFCAGWLVMLLCLPKTGTRYLLPCTITLVYFSGMALGATEGRIRKRAAIAVAIVLVAGGGFVLHGYATDSRRALAKKVLSLPSGSPKIATDKYVLLHPALHDQAPDAQFPEILTADYLPSLGDLDELRQQGITHVIICRDSAYRFTGLGQRPAPDKAASWDRFREIYLDIRSRGELLWSAPARPPIFLHPGLELYELPGE